MKNENELNVTRESNTIKKLRLLWHLDFFLIIDKNNSTETQDNALN
jgi:hypothetical protein